MRATCAHELMRAMEVHAIADCAEMAAKASLFRRESRWGLYRARVDYPEREDDKWRVHVQVQKSHDGAMRCFTRPLDPYVVQPDDEIRDSYQKLRVAKATAC